CGGGATCRRGSRRERPSPIKPTPFTEDAEGYTKLFGVLGAPTDALVAMEATGHYWKNLFAALVATSRCARVNEPAPTITSSEPGDTLTARRSGRWVRSG